MKHAFEASMDARDSRIGDGDKREVDDRRKHRSSKSRKHSIAEETEEHDGGRRKSSGDKNDGRKRPSSSSRAGSGDEDDYNVKRESSSKAPRKNPEERREKRSSEGFQDREAEATRKSRDEESDRNSLRKTNTISSGHESSHSKNRSNMETPHESVLEKVQDKDSRYPERKDSSIEIGQKHHDTDTDGKTQTGGYTDKHDSRSVKPSDHNKHGPSGDRTMEPRYESGEVNVRAVRSSSDKDVRSTSMEERRIDGVRSKSRSRLDAQDENNRPITADANKDDKQRKIQERTTGLVEAVEPNARRYTTKLHEEKGEGHRQQLDFVSGSRDEIKNQKRSVNLDEDEHSRMSDRSGMEVGHKERPLTPERSGRHHRDLDDRDQHVSESDNERSLGLKGKEPEEGYRVDRPSKGKENNEIGKCRDFEDSKDQWKRSQTRQDSKEGDTEFDHVKEKDSLRREQERVEGEKFHRLGYRGGTRIRPEDGTELSIFGSENKNTNTIEIIPNGSRDFGRQESFPRISRRRAELGSQDSQQDFVSGMNDEEWGHPPKEKEKMPYGGHGDDLHERYNDGCSPSDQNPRRNSLDIQRVGEHKGTMNTNNSGFGGSTSSGSFNRVLQQGPKAARPARGGRGRLTGRETQRVGVPPPMMDPPFGHHGVLPGPMQTIAPNMPHSPGPPIGPGVLTAPFTGPLVWPGALGVDMNMLAAPAGTRFALNMGTGSVHGMYFNQAGLGRGALPNISAPGFNSTGINSYGTQHDKVPTGWGPLKSSGPCGRAPSRGEQNDYSQNFVDTGMRPQNFIRELELTNVVEDYPKLRDLIQKKDEIVAKSASPPMYYKCDLHEHVLSPEFFGTKFDVILVDPPWEEYVHRAPGITDHMEHWSLEEIQNLKIEAISDTPSFIFLWVGDGAGLEQGRLCLKKWGFRRCEDICWVKTNKTKASPGLRHDSRTLFQHSKEHCLMGIKGTVRRSIDGHVIHANIDTDVIIADEPAFGSTKKPEDMYRIIEHFSLGRRRLELFGEDHNIRSGWVTIGKGLSSSNFNFEAYIRNFADKEGKVWQGIGGRNPPPEAPHLVVTTPEIENLRPRSPPSKNQQQQTILLQPTGSSNNRRPAGSSLQYPMAAPLPGLNHDTSGSDPLTSLPWAASPRPEGGHGGADNKFIDGYGFDV